MKTITLELKIEVPNDTPESSVEKAVNDRINLLDMYCKSVPSRGWKFFPAFWVESWVESR